MSDTRDYSFVIRGVTCEHCVIAVEKAVRGVRGVEHIHVDLGSGLARVRAGEDLLPQQVVAAVEQAGYAAEFKTSDLTPPMRARRSSPVRDSGSSEWDADLIIVGGGSAGFAAAIRGHELGARVIMVNLGTIGGTCVNVGCVPSKTLIRAAEANHRAGHQPFAGLESSSRVKDFAALIRQKDELVASLRKAKYVDVLAAYDDIRLVEARARFVSPDAIQVNGRELRAPRIVVATGSYPWIPPIPGLYETDPLTSTSAFELERLPASIIVLGGRYIALECAQMFSRLGSRVTLLQRSNHVLPGEDNDVTERLTGYLRDEGIQIETGVKFEEVIGGKGHISVHAEVAGEDRIFAAERILCATGRRPNTRDMHLEESGVRLGEDERVVVDDFLQTSATGIFAAGDVTGEPAFVYTAAYEGNLAAENALGASLSSRDYNVLPWVIFTDPQIAGVGLNEKESECADLDVDVSRLALPHVPRALAARDTRGFIKMVKERGTDRLVGVRVLAPEGGEQIMEAAMAIRYGISVSELAGMFHPYLTQAEGMKLCAQAFLRDISKLSCCSA